MSISLSLICGLMMGLLTETGCREIKTVIIHFDRALIERDSMALAPILHEELGWRHSNGWIQTREDVFRDFREATIQYDEIESSGLQILPVDAERQMKVKRSVHVKRRF